MIGTSLGEWILIQVSILIFRYTPVIYALALAALYTVYGAGSVGATQSIKTTLWGLLLAEAVFYCTIYFPYTQKLKEKTIHPEQLSYKERQALFQQCFTNVSDLKTYLHWWFLGAELDEIHRLNMEEFLLWAFFETEVDDLPADRGERDAVYEEIGEYITAVEDKLDHRFAPGRGPAKSLRLTLDGVDTTYRSLLWYAIVFAIDVFTHAVLAWNGFQFYGRCRSSAAATFPPRPQELLGCRRSPAPDASYWYRAHGASNRPPIVFFHGIGLGMLIYIKFLVQLHAAKKDDGQGGVGIIAIELMPVTFRLTSQPYRKRDLLQQVSGILQHHKWDEFSIVSHSFGSVPTTHMLQSPALRRRVHSVVLVDPVTILLHLPHVAYNFTRRRPREANEWQLWYFASTDPQVARCLGRHFFWRENILWKEELMALTSAGARNEDGTRKVAVCLAGKDIIVDAAAVAQYLSDDASSGRGGIDVLWFPKLDHAQVFDSPTDYKKIIDRIVGGGDANGGE